MPVVSANLLAFSFLACFVWFSRVQIKVGSDFIASQIEGLLKKYHKTAMVVTNAEDRRVLVGRKFGHRRREVDVIQSGSGPRARLINAARLEALRHRFGELEWATEVSTRSPFSRSPRVLFRYRDDELFPH